MTGPRVVVVPAARKLRAPPSPTVASAGAPRAQPDIAALSTLLRRYAAAGATALEPAREAAVMTAVAGRADALQAQSREADSKAITAKYTRRAVVGAMAAVMPGTDLVVQGVLATALIRELSKLYEVPVRDLDIDAFLGQVKLTVRTSTSIVLAIAGNAAKAFPGLGTLGGGVLHAIAYGLIFDSLGEAVATTLRDQRKLDAAAAGGALARLLAEGGSERLRHCRPGSPCRRTRSRRSRNPIAQYRHALDTVSRFISHLPRGSTAAPIFLGCTDCRNVEPAPANHLRPARNIRAVTACNSGPQNAVPCRRSRFPVHWLALRPRACQIAVNGGKA